MLQERLSYALPGPSRIIDSLLIYLLTYLLTRAELLQRSRATQRALPMPNYTLLLIASDFSLPKLKALISPAVIY